MTSVFYVCFCMNAFFFFFRLEPVMTHKMRAKYKGLFFSDYQEYLRLHEIVQNVGTEFHKMKELLEKHAPGTEEYQVCIVSCSCMTAGLYMQSYFLFGTLALIAGLYYDTCETSL